MANTKFSDFTTSSTPLATEFAVGYATAVSGGERRWLWSDVQTLLHSPPVTIPVYQSGNAWTFTTPNPTSVTYDTNPIAAIYINGPAAATTRNFISGIWINTNGATTDKGRGIGIVNTGASDSLYLQQDGVGSTGIAVLLTTSGTSAFGGVFGTTLSTQTALTLRQDTPTLANAASATLLSVEANGAVTEMVRMNSTVASQSGIVFRMLGATSNAFSVLGAADAVQAQMTTAGALTITGLTNNGTALFDKGSSAGTPAAAIAASVVIRLGNADAAATALQGDSYGAGNSLILMGRGAGGTRASPSATTSAKALISFEAYGFDTALTTTASAKYQITAGSLWSVSNRETKHTFTGTPSGSTTAATWMTLDGANGAIIPNGLNNTAIGNITTSSGAFTTLTSSTTAKFTAADNINNGFISATMGVRMWGSSTGYNIEGVDNTLTNSYQILAIGGVSVTISNSGVAMASFASNSLTINGSSSGAIKFAPVAATAQTVTIATDAQTTGATTLTLPDMAGVSDTFAFLAKNQTFTGVLTLTPGARSSGVAPYFQLNAPTDTAQTAATASPGVKLATATRTWATTGTVALQREVWLQGMTYASAGASQTFTDITTLYVDRPLVGTNAVFTRAHSLVVVDSTSAASAITGGLIVATTLGTAATSVGIGGGNINAGGTGIFAGLLTASNALTVTAGATSLKQTTIAGAAATTALTITQTARTSGVLPYIKWTIPTDTAQTAATESPGVQVVSGTRQWATTGTVALQREMYFAGPTYASASASQTFTEVCTLYLDRPLVGTNAIFTRAHTLVVVDSTSAASAITGGLIVATTLGTAATSVGIGGGNINAGGTITCIGGATFLTTSSALTDGAGVGAGTILTAPAAGNPTKWIGINDNGTTRYIPAW